MKTLFKILLSVIVLCSFFSIGLVSYEGSENSYINKAHAEESNRGITLSDKYLVVPTTDPNETRFDYRNYLDGETEVTFTSDQMDTAKVIWKFLEDNTEYDDIVIAGIIGNIFKESSLDPTASNTLSGAYGLVQWLGGRHDNLASKASSMGKSKSDINVQLEHLLDEFNDPSYKKRFTDKLEYAETIDDATALFMIWFETPANTESDFASRIGASIHAFENISGEDLGTISSGDSGSSDSGENESGSYGDGRGEYTGNLEYDPFEDEGVVQNSTGIKDGNQGTIHSQETYVASQWIQLLVDIILIALIVILALYMILIAIVVLLISFTNSYISDNKAVRWLIGPELLDKMVGQGFKAVFIPIMLRFLIGSFVLIVAITGMINGLQYIFIDAVRKALEFIGL